MRIESMTLAAGALMVLAAAAPAQSAVAKPDCAKLESAAIDHASMDHAAHAQLAKDCGAALPTLPGQAAFGAISEVVRMLKADPNTDWSKVNVEALRQHLIDMDDVTMHAVVSQRNVPGGVEMRVTGAGRTAEAIKRMAINHTRALEQGPDYHATAREIGDGALITITAKNQSDSRMADQIRGLGFAGLMTEGDHHAAHHLMLARGEAPHSR